MPTLSIDQLNNLNPEKLYNIQTFVLHHTAWNNVCIDLQTIIPLKVKFNAQMLPLLTNSKGIYIFYIEPGFPFAPEARYPMYVGRVIGRNTFRNRFGDYVRAIGSVNERRNIQLLTNLWPDKTWVYFYELPGLTDDEITAIEDNLIDNIIPPMNNKFKAVSAKNSRSIYH